MSDNTIDLAEAADDNRFTTARQMLEAAIKEIDEGKIPNAKAVLIVLDKGPTGEDYNVFTRIAGLQYSAAVALLFCKANQLSRIMIPDA
jgi:hypothetical protein